jgi:hypothetical protein
MNKAKQILKKISFIFYLGMKYRAWAQSSVIRSEQRYYEKKAGILKIKREMSLEEIKQCVHRRLAARGINSRLNAKRELHIVYASVPAPWDRQHIVPGLKKFGRVSEYFFTEHGFKDDEHWLDVRQEMNSHFLKYIKALHTKDPIDLLLTYYSGYRIFSETLKDIGKLGIILSTFHFDDRVAFKGKKYRGRWSGPYAVAGEYDLNLTHAPESLVKYRVEGAVAMLWHPAANKEIFYPRQVPLSYDVSFVGTAHMGRKPFMEYLKDHGIDVKTFGSGWPGGFIPDEKVPEIFSMSRINLNFDDIGYTKFQCSKARDFEIPMSGGLL